jgi:hypothetical protein
MQQNATYSITSSARAGPIIDATVKLLKDPVEAGSRV